MSPNCANRSNKDISPRHTSDHRIDGRSPLGPAQSFLTAVRMDLGRRPCMINLNDG